ncbi:hypothetical protein [Vaginisenegalia massiliensis]|uniref:hypothetical protein n=1 Tax=Vaginisenegalia massiliensis TaxID=2058294 RepID=UPI0013DE140C|nr:hypothetical protein [Vaginisenegalia massiliensis]
MTKRPMIFEEYLIKNYDGLSKKTYLKLDEDRKQKITACYNRYLDLWEKQKSPHCNAD